MDTKDSLRSKSILNGGMGIQKIKANVIYAGVGDTAALSGGCWLER